MINDKWCLFKKKIILRKQKFLSIFFDCFFLSIATIFLDNWDSDIYVTLKRFNNNRDKSDSDTMNDLEI